MDIEISIRKKHKRTRAKSVASSKPRFHNVASAPIDLSYYKNLLSQGVALLKSGNTDEGTAAINKAISVLPPDKSFYHAYFTILKELKLTAEIIHFYKVVVRHFPDDISIIEAYADYLIERRELYKAYKAVAKGLKINSSHIGLLKLKLKCALMAGRSEQTLAIANDILARGVCDAMILEKMAEAYYQLGEIEQGLALYKRISQEFPLPDYLYRAGIMTMLHGQLVDTELLSRRLAEVARNDSHRSSAKELSNQLRYIHVVGSLEKYPKVQGNPTGEYDIVFLTFNNVLENGGGHQPTQIARCLTEMGHRVLYGQPYAYDPDTRENFNIFNDPFLRYGIHASSSYMRQKYDEVMNNIFPEVDVPRKKLLVCTGASLYINSLIPFFREHGYDVAYWCIDDWQGINEKLAPRVVERWLAQHVDITAATATGLAEKLSQDTHCETPVISNGYSLAQFPLTGECPTMPEDMVQGDKTFVYWGGIELPWIDWAFMYEVMLQHPQWAFNFIGAQPTIITEEYQALGQCMKLANAHFLGIKKVHSLYGYGRNADYAVLHFNSHTAAKSMNHVKVYEYLACGLPIVATHCPGLIGVPGVLQVKSVSEFVAAVKSYDNTPPSREDILGYLKGKSWFERAKAFMEMVDNNNSRGKVLAA